MRTDAMKSVAVFTSTRAEYGLLLPLLRLLTKDAGYDLRLLAGGSHLSPAHGRTIDRIREDGFAIRREFPFLEAGPVSECMAALTSQLGAYFAEEKPDLLVLLGDRFELLPAASVALVAGIPIAHISGGDTTEGSIDNQVRHAVSKMAHVHFPATEESRRVLERMGEEAWRICVAGEPGLDEILGMRFLDREELFTDLALPADREMVIATFHPETIANAVTPAMLEATTAALLAGTGYQFLFTAANFDPGGDALNACLRKLAAENPRIRFVESLGQKRYYSALRCARAMLGNSSSGLTEAQSFGLPTVNVGKRQQGRLANPNVLDCAAEPAAIVEALRQVVSPPFLDSFRGRPNLYGDGRAAPRMLAFLDGVDFSRLLLKRSAFT